VGIVVAKRSPCEVHSHVVVDDLESCTPLQVGVGLRELRPMCVCECVCVCVWVCVETNQSTS